LAVRPNPDQLLQSLRVSLADTLVPAIEDRWARYVATAMDLVLQHLQLRLAGEFDAVGTDNLDMSQTLASLATTASRTGADHPEARDVFAPVLDALGEPPPEPSGAGGQLAAATRVNEELRARLVAVLGALDRAEAGRADDRTSAALATLRDDVHRLIRRQVDRMNPLVVPLHMSFSPAPPS
jgi:hypothetical protein